ncbi:TPA: hypothetical protein EYP75_06125 [Candidatus Bathyarchaeota archaeon]|nr:hypothetical protein [Candidatus Bathyarchaeota archaeon]
MEAGIVTAYLKPYVWLKSDIKLKCSFCNYSTEIEKGKLVPDTLEIFQSRGRLYISCPKCINGYLKIFVKTRRGKWRLKAKTLDTEAIMWRSK